MLGRYVREQGVLPLMEALRKMTLMPAQRLAARVPAMRNKGRIREGADADIIVFDADRIIDSATFQAQRPSERASCWSTESSSFGTVSFRRRVRGAAGACPNFKHYRRLLRVGPQVVPLDLRSNRTP